VQTLRTLPTQRFGRLLLQRASILALLLSLLGPIVPANALVNRWQALQGMTAISTSGNGTNADTTCAVADGKAYCWGHDNNGQIGNGSGVTANQPLPVLVGGLLAGKTVTDISVGLYFVCAVADGKAYCWGSNSSGQLGDNSTTTRHEPVAVVDTGVLSGKTVTSIDVGQGHTCAVADGLGYCWGAGGRGRLGNGGTSGSNVPVAVSTSGGSALNGKTVVQIEAAGAHSCARTSDNAVACWGDGEDGSIGNSTYTTTNSTPVAITINAHLSGKTITWLSAGNATSCVIAGGLPFCWGNNAASQLGNGGTANVNEATPPTMSGVLNGKTFTRITTGTGRTCVLDTAGLAYCYGASRTGDNTSNNRTTPVAVTVASPSHLTGQTIKYIVTGYSATCTISTTEQAFCWGTNGAGQLGDNTATTRNAAVSVLADGGTTLSGYRVYRNANATTPGTPLAADDTAATLPMKNQAFRVRMAANGTATANAPIQLLATTGSFVLQFAQRTAGSCAAQTTGWGNVTTTSTIAWQTNAGVSNGAAITPFADDPSVANPVHQTYRSSGTNFNNPNTIPSTGNGLWDFSLRDNSAPASTTYCLRLVYNSGSAPLEHYAVMPEVTTSSGVVSVDIVNAGGGSVPAPSFAFSSAFISATCQTTTSTVGASAQRIRVTNGMASGTGWSLSLAASDGATAVWSKQDDSAHYDYNDPSGSPPGCGSGSDGDGLAGQLSLNPAAGTIAPESGCSSSGVSLGSSGAFEQAVADSITLVTASTSAQAGCYYDLTGVEAAQTLPGGQGQGNYGITMTLTATAQ